MTWIANAVSGLLKPIGDIFKEREHRKTVLAEAEAKQTEILTAAASADSAVAGQIALVNANNQNNTWKDEYALITITAPYWVSLVIGLASGLGLTDVDTTVVIASIFEPMAQIPEYWQETFKIGILSALGVTVLKKVIK